ncbi:MAG: hypothetical protein IPK82_20795 [Polyangiaceae bacterium]|nr:hypothetical protein [Polyangiaceae bacterium]
MRALAERAVFACVLAAFVGACASVPTPQKKGERPPQLSKELAATDLLPADLDVVLRIDVARIKAGLGPAFAESLAERAAEQSRDGFIAEAMSRADAVWIGLRLADIDAGDRVLIAEGKTGEIHLEPSEWAEVKAGATIEDVHILDRKGTLSRASTGRIVVAKDRLIAFVSPAEVDAVSRLLKNGADEGHGDPAATGLVSMDVRGHRLPPALEKKYPSIGAVIAGISKIRGSAAMGDSAVNVNVEVYARSEPDAERAEKFLVTVRDAALNTRYADAMKTVAIERAGATIHLKANVPASFVIAALSASAEP